jgi:hypothetical protein
MVPSANNDDSSNEPDGQAFSSFAGNKWSCGFLHKRVSLWIDFSVANVSMIELRLALRQFVCLQTERG